MEARGSDKHALHNKGSPKNRGRANGVAISGGVSILVSILGSIVGVAGGGWRAEEEEEEEEEERSAAHVLAERRKAFESPIR
jgi:hypothetical protein